MMIEPRNWTNDCEHWHIITIQHNSHSEYELKYLCQLLIALFEQFIFSIIFIVIEFYYDNWEMKWTH